MKFKETRKLVSKNDAISIALGSTGDVYDNYIDIYIVCLMISMKWKSLE